MLTPMQYFGRVVSGDRVEMSGYGSRFEGVVRSVVPPVKNQTFELRIDMSLAATGEWSIGRQLSVTIPLRGTR